MVVCFCIRVTSQSRGGGDCYCQSPGKRVDLFSQNTNPQMTRLSFATFVLAAKSRLFLLWSSNLNGNTETLTLIPLPELTQVKSISRCHQHPQQGWAQRQCVCFISTFFTPPLQHQHSCFCRLLAATSLNPSVPLTPFFRPPRPSSLCKILRVLQGLLYLAPLQPQLHTGLPDIFHFAVKIQGEPGCLPYCSCLTITMQVHSVNSFSFVHCVGAWPWHHVEGLGSHAKDHWLQKEIPPFQSDLEYKRGGKSVIALRICSFSIKLIRQIQIPQL